MPRRPRLPDPCSAAAEHPSSSDASSSGTYGTDEKYRTGTELFSQACSTAFTTLVPVMGEWPSGKNQTIALNVYAPKQSARPPCYRGIVVKIAMMSSPVSCLRALQYGYRHIGTAQYYGNESEAGDAVEIFGIPRSAVFLTTKILGPGDSVEDDYDRHIEELKEFAKTWPLHANQIERGIVDYCHKNGIAIEAYSPVVRNTKTDDETPVVGTDKHGVSPNHVLIRYSLEKKWIPLPKSDNPDRIGANNDGFRFSLGSDNTAALDSLDQGRKGIIVMAVEEYEWVLQGSVERYGNWADDSVEAPRICFTLLTAKNSST
ncbi:hypothetical protein DL767_001408 [Monosporascus sp. MG133]|nr:hypothetical protein DL767_001408 [Monosporascus sp. MG133]